MYNVEALFESALSIWRGLNLWLDLPNSIIKKKKNKASSKWRARFQKSLLTGLGWVSIDGRALLHVQARRPGYATLKTGGESNSNVHKGLISCGRNAIL